MSQHGHDHGHGGHCNHDDDDHLQVEGQLDFLYKRIDRDHVVALNAAEASEPSKVFRPWDERDVDDHYLESDADDQLILHIPFTGSVKRAPPYQVVRQRADHQAVRSLILKAGPSGYTPDKFQIFANQRLDFDEASDAKPTFQADVAISKEAIEYALPAAKLSNVQHLTLFFPASRGEDTTRISFVGFRGEFTALTRDPIITVYEAQANPADHAKIPGLDSAAHSRLG